MNVQRNQHCITTAIDMLNDIPKLRHMHTAADNSCVLAQLEPRLVAHRDAVAALCRRHGVSRLDVFGSAADGRFDPLRSDYDFIVRFAPLGDLSLAHRYVALTEALESLLGRPVDMMTDHEIDNPYLRSAIEATRQHLYDDTAAKAPV